jgi:hypothetical protein
VARARGVKGTALSIYLLSHHWTFKKVKIISEIVEWHSPQNRATIWQGVFSCRDREKVKKNNICNV